MIAGTEEFQLSLFENAPWPSDMRALPNDYARSSLFTTRNKRAPRKALEGVVIYTTSKDVKIIYTGIELRVADDELVWQQVLEYAKHAAPGEPVEFSFYRLCVDIGWPTNGHYYAKSKDCLSRLQASAMSFHSQRVGRIPSLSLIESYDYSTGRNSRCRVKIDKRIAALFAGNNYTRMAWEPYRALTPTARSLYDYLASHRDPYPLDIEKFRMLCGSEDSRKFHWRARCREACTELVEAELVFEAWVNKNLIHCKRRSAKAPCE